MFETSVVRDQAVAARGRYRLLTVSIAAHTAVVVGAVAISVASVSFPKNAPNEFALAPMFVPVSVPPPLGNPNAAQQPKPAQPAAQKPAAPAPAQLTAPSTIPETVQPVQSASSNIGETTSTTTDSGEPGTLGVPWGTKDSVGALDAPPLTTTAPAVEDKVYTAGGEVKAPVLLRRVEPVYPPMLMRTRMSGKVVVHCIIDKNGRVRDAQIVYATMPPFADSVVRALDGWRYTPASLHGEAVECYLDLTVDFGVR
ncbi:MAG TPA: energy transducer TonB [Thermoanaerobaculia bacterium]|jgi:protein TonB